MNRYLYNGEYFSEADDLPGFDETSGVFETMLVWNGEVKRRERHLKRAEDGLHILHVKNELSSFINTVIQEFIIINKIVNGRLKLQFFLSARTNSWGAFNYLLSYTELPAGFSFSADHACRVLIYGGHIKPFSSSQNAKLNERSLYRLALELAEQEGADDALVLNEAGRPIESTISNLWWRKNDTWYTPSLAEGPVAGTIRALLLEDSPFRTAEAAATLEKLYHAEEIMLTNAIRGVRPVAELQGKLYPVSASAEIAAWLRQQ